MSKKDPKLTAREIEILKKASLGYTTEEMSKLLKISMGVVRNRLTTIRLKLRVRNTAHAVAVAKDDCLI